jgi:hypothetical protein
MSHTRESTTDRAALAPLRALVEDTFEVPLEALRLPLRGRPRQPRPPGPARRRPAVLGAGLAAGGVRRPARPAPRPGRGRRGAGPVGGGLVETLAQGRGLWAFADEHQRFWSERALPPSLEALPRLRLPAQHRSPPGLAAFAARYAGGGPDGRLVGGGEVRVVVAPARDVLDWVRHEVETLLREKVGPADIAVLSLAGLERSALLKRASLGKVPLARADAPEAADRVVADTFLRFKGLERPFVVVTELVHGPKMQYETRMHIALTRATAGAIVVCDEEAVGRDERLGGLVARGRLGA